MVNKLDDEYEVDVPKFEDDYVSTFGMNLRKLENKVMFLGGHSGSDEGNTCYKSEYYIDTKSNNMIFAFFITCKKDDLPDDVLSAVSKNVIDEAYDHAINALNTSKNTLLFWKGFIENPNRDTIIYPPEFQRIIGRYRIYYDLLADICWDERVDICKIMDIDAYDYDSSGIHNYIEIRDKVARRIRLNE